MNIWQQMSQWSWYSALLLALVAFLTWIIYVQVIKPYLSPLRKIPGFPYRPFSISGSMHIITKGQTMEEALKAFKHYGSPLLRYYFFFGSERIMVADPAVLKHVLVTNSRNYIKPAGRLALLRAVIGEGLVTSEEPVHSLHKKLISPTFNNAAIKKMLGVFVEKTDLLVAQWEKALKESNKEYQDLPIQTDLANLTLEVIGKTAFGYELHCLGNTGSKSILTSAIERVVSENETSWRLALPFYIHLPIKESRRMKSNIRIAEDSIYQIINDKQQKLQENKDMESVTNDTLGMMMLARDEKTGQGLSNKELRDQVMTIMLAGHETTAVGMSWCLLTLAQHPEIQQKAREEAQRVAPEGTEITTETLDKLDYVNLVIKEVLRLFPPVPVTLREALRDDKLGPYFIPKGTIIQLCMGAMMRLKENFSDPETFNPERFRTEEGQNMYTFLPFLIGSRMCVGYKFALQEMKVILVSLLRKFEFSQIPGTEYKRRSRITMRPNPALHLRVSLTNQNK